MRKNYLFIAIILLTIFYGCHSGCNTSTNRERPEPSAQKPPTPTKRTPIKSNSQRINDSTYLVTWNPVKDSSLIVYVEVKRKRGEVIKYPQPVGASEFRVIDKDNVGLPSVWSTTDPVALQVDIDIILLGSGADINNVIDGELLHTSTSSNDLRNYLMNNVVNCNGQNDLSISYFVKGNLLTNEQRGQYYQNSTSTDNIDLTASSLLLYNYFIHTPDGKIQHDQTITNIINTYFTSDVSWAPMNTAYVVRRNICQ